MAKTKFFRIATSGATTDGRTIDPQTLLDMAQTYDPKTYQARVNIEHIRGAHPDSAFGSYGDVLSLKTEPVTLNVGGKDEQRTGLYAEIDAHDPLVKLRDAKQKIFTSIEVQPNFAKSGKAYLGGLAFTDNPASLGTEMMKFCASLSANGAGEASPLHFRKSSPDAIFTEAEETSFEFAETTPVGAPGADPKGNPIMDALRRVFGEMGFSAGGTPPVPAPAAPAVDPAAGPAASPMADPALQQAFTGLRGVMEQAATAIAAAQAEATAARADFATATNALTAQTAEIASIKAELGAATAALAKTRPGNFTPRPASTGGGGDANTSLRTDC